MRLTNFLIVCGTVGIITGEIIRLISDFRRMHGENSLQLGDCGRFVLADDLNSIVDMTNINLSGITSLKGKDVTKLLIPFVYESVRLQ